MNANYEIDTGKQAIAYFHNECVSAYPQNYSFTYPALIAAIDAAHPSFFQALGFAILYAHPPEYVVQSVMEDFAIENQGRLPRDLTPLIKNLSDASHETKAIRRHV